jgi:aminoglycoside phosphotransferase (APT) family kinase protein
VFGVVSVNNYQRQLDDEQLAGVLAACGVDPGRMASWSELSEASFNTAYRIRLTGGDGLVLKVAPDPAMPVLAYEHDIMRTETLFYRTAAGVVPVPRVVHADFSRQLIDSDYLLMTELPGENWYWLRDQVTDGDRTRLRTELGGLVAALHRITGTEFGYPQGKTDAGWRVAFLGMLDALLSDAVRWATPLPLSVTRIRALADANAGVLDEVTTPVLVHFDLWPGNILLDRGTITGLVDGERAFWGDPLAEMASLELSENIEDDDAFLDGYGGIVFDGAARRRLALYRAYLYLIMLVEGAPRGYSGPEREALVTATTRELRTVLTELEP